MKFDKIIEQVLTEKYEIEVGPTNVQVAIDVFRDQFKRLGKMDSDGTFTFKSIEDAADFVQSLSNEDIPDDEIEMNDDVMDYIGI